MCPLSIRRPHDTSRPEDASRDRRHDTEDWRLRFGQKRSHPSSKPLVGMGSGPRLSVRALVVDLGI